MLLLYQAQVVSYDVYIGGALEKLQIWPTKSAFTKIPTCAKPLNFLVCSHLKILRGFLSNVINLSSKIRTWGMHAIVFKQKKKKNNLGKFVTKPTSQNHWRTKVPDVNICPELSYFDQRAKFWSIYVWIHQEPYKYPLKKWRNERERKIWRNTL